MIYKWLGADNSAPLGKGKWTPGRWRSVKGELIPCENGLHFCRSQDLIHHIRNRLWLAEIDASELIEAEDKIVVRRARVIQRVETINDCTLRLFACDCAAWTQPKHPDSINAIAVARRYARGLATEKELSAARSAAESAAGSAARSAAWSAARSAAWSAAWSAAESAAESVAWSAAWSAAWKRLTARFLQYVEHGESAEAMPWPESDQ